jgi:acetyl-CoA acetyltransferase family protein
MGQPVLIAAVRSPVAAVHGQLAAHHPVELLAFVLDGLARAAPIDPTTIDDVVVGCVEQVGGQSGNVARAAVLAAGWPATVPACTLDRGALSGVSALAAAVAAVRAGTASVVVAAAVDLASVVPPGAAAMGRHAFGRPWHGLPDDVPVPTAAEVAEALGISRAAQDEWAARSIEQARAAVAAGRFDAEVVVPSGSPDRRDELVADRPTRTELPDWPPLYAPDGTLSAGNTAPAADGAAAVLVADAAWARAHGAVILAELDAAITAAGCDDTISAALAAVAGTGITAPDADGAELEVHEPSAAVAVALTQQLGLRADRANPDGGAIALGNPTASATLRAVVTLVHRLGRADRRVGVFVAGVPGGGAAVVLRR